MAQYPLNLTDEEHKKLKTIAAQTGKTIKQIIMESLEMVLTAPKKGGKP